MKPIRIIILVFSFLLILLFIGFNLFDKPRKKVFGENLPQIKQIEYNKDSLLAFNDDQIKIFKRLEFTLAKENYPGETPDFQYIIRTETSDYNLIYNSKDDKIFFIFGDDFNYNFISIPNGGWNKPLYYIHKTEEVEKLFPFIKQ